jgi:hypothetical protein
MGLFATRKAADRWCTTPCRNGFKKDSSALGVKNPLLTQPENATVDILNAGINVKTRNNAVKSRQRAVAGPVSAHQQ